MRIASPIVAARGRIESWLRSYLAMLCRALAKLRNFTHIRAACFISVRARLCWYPVIFCSATSVVLFHRPVNRTACPGYCCCLLSVRTFATLHISWCVS